jgi:hypothetical protein
MNAESILTGVITGVLTGVIASAITGYFGVLYAFKQFRTQKAFDRQLEWYERTARALWTFWRLNRIDTKESEECEKAKADLLQCFSESFLYAEPTSYDQLNRMVVELVEIEDIDEESKHLEAFNNVIFASLIELSKPLRKKLRLKKIDPT